MHIELFESDYEIIEDFYNAVSRSFNPKNKKNYQNIIDATFDVLTNFYDTFKDSVPSVSMSLEKYKHHLIYPKNRKFTLLDFLLNRCISNFLITDFDNMSINYDGYLYQMKIYEYYFDSINKYYVDKIQRKEFMAFGYQILTTFDNEENGCVHSIRDEIKTRNIIGDLLSKLKGKYDILRESKVDALNISEPEKIAYSFNDRIINNAFREYVALDCSKLLDSYVDFSLRQTCGLLYSNGPDYLDDECNYYRFAFHISNFVSRKDLFYSMFFGNSEVIDNLYIENKKILDKKYQLVGLEEYLYNCEDNKISLLLSSAFEFNGELNVNINKIRVNAIAVLEDFFSDLYNELLLGLNTDNLSYFSKVFKIAYMLSPVIKNEKNFKNSNIKSIYKEKYDMIIEKIEYQLL